MKKVPPTDYQHTTNVSTQRAQQHANSWRRSKPSNWMMLLALNCSIQVIKNEKDLYIRISQVLCAREKDRENVWGVEKASNNIVFICFSN